MVWRLLCSSVVYIEQPHRRFSVHYRGTEENKIIDEVREINDQTFKSHKMDEEEVSIEDVPDVKEESAVLEFHFNLL
ncbi:hypothetical protein Bca4012_066677 [Brassica carinata]